MAKTKDIVKGWKPEQKNEVLEALLEDEPTRSKLFEGWEKKPAAKPEGGDDGKPAKKEKSFLDELFD